MPTAGRVVVRESGKRGVLPSGRAAVFNAEGKCPTCCIEFTQAWSFTDQGFIAGGQNGALRSYDDPASVPASPWTIQNNGLGLRLDWEDDENCAGFNPNTQYATATAAIIVPVDTVMTVTWSGVGETEAPNFELMSLSVDGTLVGEAHAPGGGQGCAPMGPVVSDPPPPQQVLLTAGEHTLTIDATTNDALYHFGAFYQFGLSFEEV
jgi:hypothetical protein